MEKVKGFYRDGSEAGLFNADMFKAGGFKREETRFETCPRCGGLGGSEAWRYTGWTCYQCDGATKIPKTRTYAIYTAEKLEKLRAAEVKRNEKKAIKAEEARVAEEARKAAVKEEFLREHGELLNKALAYGSRSAFIGSVVESALANYKISEKQLEAVKKTVEAFEKSDASKAASVYIGEVGEKVEFEAKVVYHRVISEGYAYGTLNHLVKLVTVDGNSVVYIGARPRIFGVKWDQEMETYSFDKEKVLKIKATVKKTDEYRGEKSTTIIRPKVI